MAERGDKTRWLVGAAMIGALAAASRIVRPSWKGPSARALQRRRDDPYGLLPGSPPPAGFRPYRMPLWWWGRVLRNTVVEVSQGRLLAVAAGVVFFALLAIFPTITAFVSFYGLFASYSTINQHIALLSLMLPPNSLGIVEEQITRIVSQSSGGRLSFAFGTGLLFALWSANAGVKAMIDALNAIKDDQETRSFVRLNLVSLSLTLGAIAFLLMAIGAVVAFPLVMSGFGLADAVDTTTFLIRWPLLLFLTLFGLSALYRYGPSAKTGGRRRSRRWFSPGALLAALLWLAGSAALSLYLSNFADYNATYGSLGAAIGLMMWMWLSAIVILVGAEFDAEIDKMSSWRRR